MNTPRPAHRMLIVDDSTIIRQRIARLVNSPQLPHITIAGLAGNGAMAVQLARENKPNLITMDLTMPLLDGEACIEQIIAFLPDTRILVVSALADKATALRAIKKGACGFLHKPFSDSELLESLLELMD
ncbi:response regulator transcription factor [Azonexus sp. IMCC34842]|uniref:response regulator transcription factor n=1 Tax=Azonexus sp. IMCC34842 TaxID=3420950 RepID=UPI003D0EC448